MKKKIFVLPLLAIVCSTLAGCSEKKESSIKLFYAYSNENLLSDLDYFDINTDEDQYLKFKDRDYTLRMHTAKGETEAIQLMIHTTEYIDEFDFELPDLVSEEGNIISHNNLEVFAEWYQFTTGTNEVSSYKGYYPDAIVPLENYKWRRMNYIQENRNQGLYFKLSTTYETAPGFYKGNGKLTLDKKKYDIPFEVTVYDIEMPEEVHARTAYGLWYDQLVYGEKTNSLEMQEAYYDFMVERRISPLEMPPAKTNTPEVFAESVYERIANNPKITTTRIPILTGSFGDGTIVRDYLQALINKNLALRAAGDNTTDLFKKVIFYIDDEPTAQRADLMKMHDKFIYETKLELIGQLSAYPDLQNSFLKINNIVTTPYYKDYVATEELGGVQTWCPQYIEFQLPSQRQAYRERQASADRSCGEEVWWYGCMGPISPYPSYHLDANLLNAQIISYMQFDYHIDGRIYWSVNYYSKLVGEKQINSRDLWYDPISYLRTAGDGYMLYPGVEFGVFGPISTLRFETVLAGNEDAEYLYMIEQHIDDYNEAKGTNLDVRVLLHDRFARLYKNMIPIDDHDVFDNVRLEIVQLLEDMNHNRDVAIQSLIG